MIIYAITLVPGIEGFIDEGSGDLEGSYTRIFPDGVPRYPGTPKL